MKATLASAMAVLLTSVAASTVAAEIPITDGEALALEFSGELLAPPEMAAEFNAHLELIRAAEPVLSSVLPALDWKPGVLSVTLYTSDFDDFLNGTYTGLDALNALYGPVEVVAYYAFIQTLVLDFEAHYNPEVLGPIYETADGVQFAGPSTLGFSETDIAVAQEGTYEFRYGWLACPSGCVYNHFWQYEVGISGVPVLLDEWGDPLVGVSVPRVSHAPEATLGRPRPTPFGSSTHVPLSVARGTTLDLNVVDVAGRHVRSLRSGFLNQGAHSARWDGRNENGVRAAPGTYFLVLETERGIEGVQKVTIVR